MSHDLGIPIHADEVWLASLRAAGRSRHTLAVYEYARSLGVRLAAATSTPVDPVVLLGDSGTGNTHLLIGLGLVACEQGRRVRYATCAQLFQVLTEREEKSSVGLALNLPFSEWGQIITDARLVAAASTASPSTPTSSRPAPSPTGTAPAAPAAPEPRDG